MTTQTQERNPFPEPQTIPSGWDTSALFPAPKVASVSDADDSAENESANPKS
ncbi:MAG: hypothetical protein JNM02_13085 [Anaerolineales bacterium]|nr:hypothetical protein [Anaerolineales bacterium]